MFNLEKILSVGRVGHGEYCNIIPLTTWSTLWIGLSQKSQNNHINMFFETR